MLKFRYLMALTAIAAVATSVGIARADYGMSPLAYNADNQDQIHTKMIVDAQNPNIVLVRELDASNEAGGEFDLNGYEPGRWGEHLALFLRNDSENASNLRIPDLNVSFLVPANTERVVYMNMRQVGVHQEVPYTVDLIQPAQIVQADTTRISELIDTNTNYDYPEDVEPTYSQPAPASRQAVRGYW